MVLSTRSSRQYFSAAAALLAVFVLGSCSRHKHENEAEGSVSNVSAPVEIPGTQVVPPTVVAPPPPVVAPPKVVTPEVAKPPVTAPPRVERVDAKLVQPAIFKTVRIKAGSATNWKDKTGHEWLADSGFVNGAMVNHGEITIDKTDIPDLYKSERSDMDKFSWAVPNGKYTVKLHFAENFEGVKKAGDRVFTVEVQSEKIKDLDVFKEAGGANKALVRTVKVPVTNGKLEINFIKSEQREPMINGIEILAE